MKKVKMKFDMDQVKQFGIEHGEKFGLALAVLILGVFIVKAVSRETLPENLRAGQITKNSALADDNIKRTPKPPADQDVGHFDFVEELRKEPVQVPKALADIPDLVRPPLNPPVNRGIQRCLRWKSWLVSHFAGPFRSSRARIRGMLPCQRRLSDLSRLRPAD